MSDLEVEVIPTASNENAEVNPVLTTKKRILKPFVLGITFVTILIVIAIGYMLVAGSSKTINKLNNFDDTSSTTEAAISGDITFQGYASSEAYLVVVEKTPTASEFTSIVSGLTPKNGIIPWSWRNAQAGVNYEIKTQLKYKGKTIQESAVTKVSAPASGVALTLISELQPPQPQVTALSGTIHLGGYIPDNSTISILYRTSGKNDYAIALSNLPAKDDSSWNWTNAQAGKTYDILIELRDPTGKLISSDTGRTVTAPSSAILLSVTSTAQPVTPAITGLSGKIIINGSIPATGYITLGSREAGSSSFNQLADTIVASNGASWSWTNAQSGKIYDIQAYLWSNGQPYAQSTILNVTAPSANNTLTINAQQQLAAPSSDSLNVVCNGEQGGGFQVTINYNTNTSLKNAISYNIVVTLASQGNQVLNTTLSPATPSQAQTLTTSYIFTPGTTYYAQYAYSTSGGTMSSLSPAIQFSCR